MAETKRTLLDETEAAKVEADYQFLHPDYVNLVEEVLKNGSLKDVKKLNLVQFHFQVLKNTSHHLFN